MKAIVTVLGKDTIGIIAGVSNVLSDAKVNILDISQTILEDYFTMIMVTDFSKATSSFSEIQESLDNAGKKIGVSVKVQREDIFNSMHNL
ncbi:ACT domain-containing protein [Clostridium sediminicola]|uniref:ACT domain-containing protein n=1 Tax=Clostridium sediminicola TaxID=3114879 RepID=UPI0031F231AB